MPRGHTKLTMTRNFQASFTNAAVPMPHHHLIAKQAAELISSNLMLADDEKRRYRAGRQMRVMRADYFGRAIAARLR